MFRYISGPGGGQNLELPNVERPIFRKFETSNIEITKLELFDFSVFEFILYFYDCLIYSNTQNTYLLFTIKFEILLIFEIQQFQNFDYFFLSLSIMEIDDFRNFKIWEFFFNLKNHNLIPKIGKFWFCSSI